MKSSGELIPAVIYARVPSKKQTKEGSGLESQTSRCLRYAQERGYAVVATFTDDMTGSKVRRPGMDEMLLFLKKRKSDQFVVLIDDISRLARGVVTHWDLRERIAKVGATLESPTVRFGETSDDHFRENILASTEQHFRQKK